MAEKLWMLALSPTMEKGVITRWLKQEGDIVTSGDVLCEVETDKAVMDYESPATGVVLKHVLPEGTSASVGDLIAIVGKPNEDISALISGGGSSGESKTVKAEQAASIEPAVQAEASSAQAHSVPSSSPSSAKAESPTGFIRSTPLARKLAELNGLPLASISGSGPLGRIIKADVEKVMAVGQPTSAVSSETATAGKSVQTPGDNRVTPMSQAAPAGPMSFAPSEAHDAQDVVIPVSGKRRIIAQRLSESMFTAPHYYLKLRVEMDELLKSR